MSVYDINGRQMAILKEEHQPAGEYTITWNGSNSVGEPFKTGVYLLVAEVKVSGQYFRKTIEMMILQ